MKKVAVGIISQRSSAGEISYLLVSSAKNFGEFTGYYYPPGGHVQDGEDVCHTLLREIKEELDLEAKILRHIAITPGDVPGQETYWYECSAEGRITINPELSDARYFNRQEFDNGKIWPATKKVFEEYIFTNILGG